MKLELKHLVGYLPYKLRIARFTFEDEYKKFFNTLSVHNIHEILAFRNLKPILHPLSDLAKEIEINGEKFVPIEVLAEKSGFKLHSSYNSEILDDIIRYGSKDYDSCNFFIYETKLINFDIDSSDNFNGRNEKRVYNNYYLIQKLLEWHFDIYELIPLGLAIDINKLKL